ncbi:MAG: AmmeMemoRadiSam system protein B [Chloroflexota bacterium]
MPIKLRPIQPMPAAHGGQAGFVLRDPLALSDKTLFVPRELAPILSLCDGSRDIPGLQATLMVQFGLRVPLDLLSQLVEQLDQACLLENDRSAAAHDSALIAYRQAPCRLPTLADKSYPAEPEALTAFFTHFETQLTPDDRASPADAGVRGVVCPHIDYPRGGRVYAGLWQRAAQAAQAAELILVLGTDHNGGGLISLTRQDYATPWGVLPTCQQTVDALAQAIGEREAFRHELHHRAEHSIELAVVWLHAVLGNRTPRLLPILLGSFQRFVQDQQEPAEHPQLAAAVETLQHIARKQRTLVIAAADLAHVGPAFGGLPLDFARRAQLRRADEQLLQAICLGDAAATFDQIRAEGDRRNICGLPPIYLTLRILGQTHGQITGYEMCPADAANTSSVSVAGVLLW